MCGRPTMAAPSRSAIVRATLSVRWNPRAESLSRSAAVRIKANPSVSGIATCSSNCPEQSALVRMRRAGAPRSANRWRWRRRAASTRAAHLRAAFGRRRQHQVRRRNLRHLDLQIDAIEKWSRKPRLVVCGAARPPLAGLPRRAAAALAGVHRRDQLEPRRVGDAMIGARDHDLAGLERLAQRIEHVRVELRQLVEKQHAEMGQRDLAGPRPRAAADQRRHAGRMVRRPERPVPRQSARRPARPRGSCTIDTSSISAGSQRRQDRRQSLRQHRFARARRADHQQVVAAGRRDLQRALGALLALDVA